MPEVIVYTDKKQKLLLIFLSVVLLAFSVWLLGSTRIAWIFVVLFGISLVVFSLLLHPRGSYVRLSEQGFEVCALFITKRVQWRDVDGFRCGIVQYAPLVFYNQKTSSGSQKLKHLPDSYNMAGPVLVKLLNEWKAKYSKELHL